MLRQEELERFAAEAGIELVGILPAGPVADFTRFQSWVAEGKAADLTYLTDHRGALRQDPRLLMESARSVLVAGVLYHTGGPLTEEEEGRGWISRYAWGARDYHEVVRERLERLAGRLRGALGDFEYRVCADTAPLLERSLAREAGLGWIGRNTCLINQQKGSWFFLGEILLSLGPEAFEGLGAPPPDRCGTCRRCIDACPTAALTVEGGLDSRRCISYWTIEAKHAAPEDVRSGIGRHVFGCDICQDVCPWNRRVAVTGSPEFAAREVGVSLEAAAAETPEEFRERYRGTAVWRTKHKGLLRNVAVAMGNSGEARFRALLTPLTEHEDADVAECARWALRRLGG